MSQGTQFRRTPPGEKTAKMLEVEARIGRSLEDDYREMYLNGQYGQTRLATRWGVKKALIFDHKMRDGRRCWVQMLGLPTKNARAPEASASPFKKQCELCGTDDVPLERAHWVPASAGGSKRQHNIVLLCPNCHTRLDQVEDARTIEMVRAVILFRQAKTTLADRSTTPQDFLDLCRSILNGRAE